ncbi:MAG: InlB B-repeat-containing protein [Clostridia bacterium]|nr:InlB B-repeat-containing protein [Clostridia bacterium]
MKSRFLSVVLVVLMTVSLFVPAFTVYADENEYSDPVTGAVSETIEERIARENAEAVEKINAYLASQGDKASDRVSDTSRMEFNENHPGEMYFAEVQADEVEGDVEENKPLYINDQIVLVAKSGVTKGEIEALAAKYDAEIVGYIEVTGDYQLKLNESRSVEELRELVDRIESEKEVASASLNKIIPTESNSLSFVPPNDARWANDWSDIPAGENWGIEAIFAPLTWQYIPNMHPVRVGLIDYIFNPFHEDVALTSIYNNPDTIDDDHASHTAGTMAATYNNGIGVCGVYPFGQLPDGSNNIYGVSFGGYDTEFEYKNALASLVVRNVKVINTSFGFGAAYGFKVACNIDGMRDYAQEYADEVGDFYQRLLDLGYDFVIAHSAGNSEDYHFKLVNGKWVCVEYEVGISTDNSIVGADVPDLANYNSIFTMIHNPDVVDRIIVIGSADHKGGMSFGKSYYSSHGSRVDVFAPGRKIWSCGLGRSNYVSMSGTSMASPHVAGTAAILWAFDNNLTGARIKEAIVRTATTPVDGTNLGMINALQALADVVDEKIGDGTKPETTGKVAGRVFINNVLWSGAKVDAVNENGDEIYVITDETGYFEFNLAPGHYRIIAHVLGGSETVEIDVTAGTLTYTGDIYVVRTHNCVFSTEYHGGVFTNVGKTLAADGIYVDSQHIGYMIPDRTNYDQYITIWPTVMLPNCTLSAWAYIIDGQFYIIRYANGARGPYWTFWEADASAYYVEALYQTNVNTATIKLDPNGGELILTPCTYPEYYVPANLQYASVIAALPKAEREGYSFRGWWADNDEGTPVFCLSDGTDQNPFGTGTNIPSLNSPVTFTNFKAWWMPNNYTIDFNANGGSGAPASITGAYDGEITIPAEKPTRKGYTFVGWASTPDAVKSEYKAGGTYTIKGEAVLYAVWVKSEFSRFTVSFDANGGAGAPASITEEFDTEIVLPTEAPIRDGYTFLGWSENQNAARPEYKAGGKYNVEKNVTLYAVWYEGNTVFYNVDFDANGGAGAPASAEAETGSEYTLPDSEPTRDGYVFLGWSKDASAKKAQYVPGDVIVIDDDLTLYAVWQQGYKVFFSADRYGGVITDNGSALVDRDGRLFFIIKDGQRFEDAVKSWPKAMKQDWAMVAWGIDGDPTKTVHYFANTNPAVTTFDHTAGTSVEVCWVPDYGTSTVIFNPNGGRIVEGRGVYYVGSGLAYETVITRTPVAEREGYSFRGWWYYDESGTPVYCISDGHELNPGGNAKNPYSLSAPCPADVLLKAYWVRNAYTVTFVTNGGTAIDAQTVLHGEKITPVETTYVGKTFAGWFTDSALTKPFLPATDTITADTILYAAWTDVEHTEHTWVVVYNTATCTEAGEILYTCSICGETKTEASSALGHQPGEWVTVSEPNCTETGSQIKVCERCGLTVETRTVAALGHTWTDWTVSKDPTTTEPGVKTRTCTRCGAVEEDEIAPVATGVDWWLEDYELLIRNGSRVNTIRLAPGHWITSSEIRNAPGLRTFSEALIRSYTDENDILHIDLLEEGEYSMWIRLNDQSTYIIHVSVLAQNITPKVPEEDINGITIKIRNLNSDVKDIFIAPGHLTTYRECNDNKIVRLYDLAGKASDHGRVITYAIDYRNVSPDGEYTMCVRYNSGRTTEISWFHIDYPTPEVTLHGLQITVSGLENIRNIRIAPGTFATASDVKKAPGVRLFSKNDKTLRDVDKNNYMYTIQCKNDGEYTLSIEYIGGYTVVTTVNVAHLEPNVVVNQNNTITFEDLDGLSIIRYAPGKITTQGAFKTTPGNAYFKAKDIAADGTITTPVLSGVWSFMVQYDELSYTIFTYDFANHAFVN